MQLQSGILLQGGKYRIIRVLGQGGFGITYEAEQVALKRVVAIKEFFMKDCCDRNDNSSSVTVGSGTQRELVRKFKTKFIKEAQMIAGFVHPGIVRIFDVFEENETAYYVMEYLPGGSLSDRIKKYGPLPENVAEGYIRQIARALDYIHARNTVHLDLKPSNVLLNSEGEAVLIDFGASKHYDTAGEQTSTTPVGYSRGYAPLEQYRDCDVSQFKPSTDIYSLGATLYTLVTGLVPPDATIVSEDGLDLVPGVSDIIWSAITNSMQSRKKRPQNIRDFLSCLSAKKEIDSLVYNQQATDVEETTLYYPHYSEKHDYVDLGLSVKWASCNIGASSPSELGEYYSWGEVSPKSDYSWMTYSFWQKSRFWDNRPVLSKYCTHKNFGTKDNLVKLEEEDDVAHLVWGGKWRMPTYKELEELLSKCQWEWTSRDGVNGYLVKSRINGNSIFLPAGGLFYNCNVWKGSSKGYYWLSTLVENYPDQADALVFDESGPYLSTYLSYSERFLDLDRCFGCLVRPVLE